VGSRHYLRPYGQRLPVPGGHHGSRHNRDRYAVAWSLSNILDIDFCLETLEKALSEAKPDFFNTDRGSHFTSEAFTGTLGRRGVRIRMDGRRRSNDNIFVDRLRRMGKHGEVHLQAYSSGPVGEQQIRVLEEEGVDLSRVYLGHINDTNDVDYILGLLNKGVWWG